MKRLLHTPLALLLRRIVLLYAVLMLCRVVFYLYNAQLLGTIGRGELWQLLAGSLKFDTVSVIYANGVFILLALLLTNVVSIALGYLVSGITSGFFSVAAWFINLF